MKRNSFILIMILFLIVGSELRSQQFRCGVGAEEAAVLTERVQANLDALNRNPIFFRDIQYVPIVFHLAGQNDGSDRALIRKAIDQICDLNNDFLETNIQFYLKDINFLNNTIVYEEHFRTTGTIMRSNRDANALNIFVVENLENPNVPGIGVTLGYYDPTRDWLVMRKDNLGNFGNITMSHEMGHFFSLPHPHNGWDSRPFVPDPRPQWAINAGLSSTPNPVPTIGPDGVPTERQNGTNCSSAGDFICDTPPDYQFGFGWSDCNYTNEVFDPTNTQVDPDETLFMSYFFGCPQSENKFSDMQQQIMVQDLNSSDRSHLRTGNIPNTTEISSVPDLIYPIDGVVTPGFNNIEFEWTGVAGADAYIFEINTLPTFNNVVLDRIVYGTSFVLEDLDLQPNRLHYWRVRPYSNGYFCTSSTSFKIFRTGSVTAVNELPFVNDWKVSPNPVQTVGILNINLQTEQQFEADMQFFGMNGQIIRAFGQYEFNAGENQFNIGMKGISRGVYLLSLQTKEGRISKRIVVMD